MHSMEHYVHVIFIYFCVNSKKQKNKQEQKTFRPLSDIFFFVFFTKHNFLLFTYRFSYNFSLVWVWVY